ncbi:hypothetical protein RB531_5390 [Salmonella enterica subsp. enterica serovar Typhimurium]
MFVKPAKGRSVPDPARGDLYLKEVEMLMRITTGCAARPLVMSGARIKR